MTDHFQCDIDVVAPALSQLGLSDFGREIFPRRLRAVQRDVYRLKYAYAIRSVDEALVVNKARWGVPKGKGQQSIVALATKERPAWMKYVANSGHCLIPATGFVLDYGDVGDRYARWSKASDEGVFFMPAIWGTYFGRLGTKNERREQGDRTHEVFALLCNLGKHADVHSDARPRVFKSADAALTWLTQRPSVNLDLAVRSTEGLSAPSGAAR